MQRDFQIRSSQLQARIFAFLHLDLRSPSAAGLLDSASTSAAQVPFSIRPATRPIPLRAAQSETASRSRRPSKGAGPPSGSPKQSATAMIFTSISGVLGPVTLSLRLAGRPRKMLRTPAPPGISRCSCTISRTSATRLTWWRPSASGCGAPAVSPSALTTRVEPSSGSSAWLRSRPPRLQSSPVSRAPPAATSAARLCRLVRTVVTDPTGKFVDQYSSVAGTSHSRWNSSSPGRSRSTSIVAALPAANSPVPLGTSPAGASSSSSGCPRTVAWVQSSGRLGSG
mmetsp:Transcript_10100/g.31857  ORF Transcript_10100/g.31857 Transcript_10100/m.31857 type:complete len:283 (-) Transcript_10100:723-1571(-)